MTAVPGFHRTTIHGHPVLITHRHENGTTGWWNWKVYQPGGLRFRAGTAPTYDQAWADAEHAINAGEVAA